MPPHERDEARWVHLHRQQCRNDGNGDEDDEQ
jgi:hypothetical protein